MKLLVQRTLQAILDAEAAFAADAVEEWGAPPYSDGAHAARRRVKTCLGTITLQLRTVECVRFVAELLDRYGTSERDFLVLLGRTLARGYATPKTVREMAETLCGHPFDSGQLATIAVAIEEQLPDYFQREFERGHGYTGSWPNVHPRSGLPRVQFMSGLLPKMWSRET